MTNPLSTNDEAARGGLAPGRRGRRRSNRPGVFLPVLIMAVGTVFLLDNLDLVESGQVLRFWPILLIGFGVKHLFQARDRAAAVNGAVLAGAGGLLLLNSLDVLTVSIWRLWPLFLIVFGFLMLVRGRSAASPAAEAADSVSTLGFLGGVQRRVRSANFSGGTVTAFMGGVELDLTEADIAGDAAVVRAFAMWGGIEIRVPETWALEIRVLPIMGGVEDKTRAASAAEPTKRLIVDGTVLMAGLQTTN